MKIVRAKSNKNKLEVFDNRPFAIEIELQQEGFKVEFLDLRTGQIITCYYADRKSFDNQWKLCYNINDEEDISYEVKLLSGVIAWKKFQELFCQL